MILRDTINTSAEELELRGRVSDSEKVLEGYESKLRAVNDEIEALHDKSREYDLLSRICRSLEELDELGAAELFWDERQDESARAERLDYAHRKIDEYGAEIIALEQKRDGILEQIDRFPGERFRIITDPVVCSRRQVESFDPDRSRNNRNAGRDAMC